MRKFLLITLTLFSIFAFTSSVEARSNKKYKKKEPPKTNFSGIITYMGKVSRIPDKSKTDAKLFDFEDNFELYMNSEYTKRIENYPTLGLSITRTEAINRDYYMQTVFSKDGNFLVIATPEEIKDYQLTAKHVRTNSLKIRKVGGKKRIQGLVCKKMISDIVTEDNIRIQLVAWYTTELFIEGYQIPYFPGLKGMPLIYDTYNGQHVVTYRATNIRKKELNDSYFGRPMQIIPITYTEFLIKINEIGNKPQEF